MDLFWKAIIRGVHLFAPLRPNLPPSESCTMNSTLCCPFVQNSRGGLSRTAQPLVLLKDVRIILNNECSIYGQNRLQWIVFGDKWSSITIRFKPNRCPCSFLSFMGRPSLWTAHTQVQSSWIVLLTHLGEVFGGATVGSEAHHYATILQNWLLCKCYFRSIV